jgi:hypothetical protein
MGAGVGNCVVGQLGRRRILCDSLRQMLIILCDLKHHLFAFVIRHILGKNPSLFGELAPVLRLIEKRTVQKSLTDTVAMERRKKPRGNQSLDLPTVSQSVRRAIAACAFRFLRRPEAQAVFFRRRHQPRSPTLAKIRPGNPAPAMGPGTTFDIAPNKPSISPLIPSVKKRVSGSPLNALARKRNALGRPRVSVRSHLRPISGQ